jgi:2-deoxy-D-gluconate 3-dehydrogenase
VSKLSDIQVLADATMREFGRIDVLVNNAGIHFDEAALDVTEEHWDRIIDTNLKGVFFCSQIIGRIMVEQQKGKIINISSTFGLVGFRNRAAYASSKAGVTNLTRVLAIEWGPYNINVNGIAPTATRTSLNEDLFADPEWRKRVLRLIPVGRFCQPQDLVGALVYLASDASDMVTGITIPVDGGWTAW